MKFSEMPYKRVNVEQFTKDVRELVQEFKASASAKEQIELVKKLDRLKMKADTMTSLAYVRYTIDTKDEFYAGERKYNSEIEPLMHEELLEFDKAMVHSPFRKELEEEFGEVLFRNLELSLKGFSPEITSGTGRKRSRCAVSDIDCGRKD